MFERRLHLFLGAGHREPGLDSGKLGPAGALVFGRALAVGDAAPGGHQIDRARLDPLVSAEAVAMLDRAGEQIGDGGQVDVRVRADVDAVAGSSCAGPIWSKKMNGPDHRPLLVGKGAVNLEAARSWVTGASVISIADSMRAGTNSLLARLKASFEFRMAIIALIIVILASAERALGRASFRGSKGAASCRPQDSSTNDPCREGSMAFAARSHMTGRARRWRPPAKGSTFMRFLLSTTAFRRYRLCLLQAPPPPQTVITTATTAPVATSTAGDLTIASTGSIKPTAARSHHEQQCTMSRTKARSRSPAPAIRPAFWPTPILTGDITNTGTITIDETYTPTDSDNDGDLDGPFAQGSNRFGIRVPAAAPSPAMSQQRHHHRRGQPIGRASHRQRAHRIADQQRRDQGLGTDSCRNPHLGGQRQRHHRQRRDQRPGREFGRRLLGGNVGGALSSRARSIRPAIADHRAGRRVQARCRRSAPGRVRSRRRRQCRRRNPARRQARGRQHDRHRRRRRRHPRCQRNHAIDHQLSARRPRSRSARRPRMSPIGAVGSGPYGLVVKGTVSGLRRLQRRRCDRDCDRRHRPCRSAIAGGMHRFGHRPRHGGRSRCDRDSASASGTSAPAIERQRHGQFAKRAAAPARRVRHPDRRRRDGEHDPQQRLDHRSA